MEVRVDGPTPAGGAYSIGTYKNKYCQPCDIEEAAYISIIEYTEDGESIACTLGLVEHPPQSVTDDSDVGSNRDKPDDMEPEAN